MGTYTVDCACCGGGDPDICNECDCDGGATVVISGYTDDCAIYNGTYSLTSTGTNPCAAFYAAGPFSVNPLFAGSCAANACDIDDMQFYDTVSWTNGSAVEYWQVTPDCGTGGALVFVSDDVDCPPGPICDSQGTVTLTWLP
jgi:hypothetical protein